MGGSSAYNKKYYQAHRGKASARRREVMKRKKARAAALAAKYKLTSEERGALVKKGHGADILTGTDRVFVKEYARTGKKGASMLKARPELVKRGAANVAAHQALHKPAVIKELSALLKAQRDAGITETYLTKKLKEGLNAEEVKYFAHEGIVQDKRVTVDHSARRGYLELAHKLRRDLEPEKNGDAGGVVINITEISGADLSSARVTVDEVK